jgi:hypothetical protein
MEQKKKSSLQRREDRKLICCDNDNIADLYFVSLTIKSCSYIYPT